MSSNPTIAALEQKYIELLERKIAALESPNGSNQTESPILTKKASATSIAAVNGDAPDSPSTKAKSAETESGDGSTTSSSIRFRQRRYTKEGLPEVTDATTTEFKQEDTKPEVVKHAMTVLRAFDEQGKYDYSIITVEDQCLRALLLHALAHYPGYSHVETISITSLFEPIIHNWSLLNEFADNDQSKPAVAKLYEELSSGPPTSLLAPLKEAGSMHKTAADLKKLLGQVENTPGLEPYFNGEREMQEKANIVSFEFLWTIFPPGELVISRVYMGQPQAFIVKESTDYISRRRRNDGRSWSLECWAYDWNGTTFNRVPVEFTFEDFKGRRSINSLPCYPLKSHRENANDDSVSDNLGNGKSIAEFLIKRGKRYRELCLKKQGRQILEYDGLALSRGTGVRKPVNTNRNQDDDVESWSSRGTSLPNQTEQTQVKRQMIKSDRVMVDFESYIQHGPQFIKYPPIGDLKFVVDEEDTCKCATCMGNDRLQDNQKPHYDRNTAEAKWEETQYLICPPRVLGYHLKSRRWVELDVDKVGDITKLKDESSFNDLQLNKTQKDLIKRLVNCHGVTDEDRTMRDLMKGKGNGLVILLHGPPGVGKTLTAESVAKATGKPLFVVGASDIGLKPAEVEHNLEVLFKLAAAWRAVMLFDEADVFLESRSSNTANLDRNALVSVLLRVLEYYDGILILTTNRIRTFDIAVQSRVNFAITYRNLDNLQKESIYLKFINQLTDENTQNKQQLLNWLDDEDLKEDPPFKVLNGRQIRNVLFSAASLAQGEPDKRLKLEHIKKILKETVKFQTDINNMIESARREAEVGYDPQNH